MNPCTVCCQGADISASDYDLRTPLHIAASEGNLEMTTFLLEQVGIRRLDSSCREEPELVSRGL